MRAFLSHSSADKGFVEDVASLLRPGTFELDCVTFDAGLVNSDAIMAALERSDLFCLFLSEQSASSSYVSFETLLGVEFIARGQFNRFLAVCLDDTAFHLASENVRFFNIVRKSTTPESVARLIQGSLVSASQESGNQTHPFLGRDAELLELEKQVTNHRRPVSKAIYISGNFGAGRRTIAHKFYQQQYPHVGRVFPTVYIDQFSGIEELYRRVLTTLRPTLGATQLRTYIQSFELAATSEKTRQVAQQLNSLLTAREAAFLMDSGGLLTDAGNFASEIDQVLDQLDSRPHPPVIFVTGRMIPRGLRRKQDDLSYLAVRALDRETTSRLISKLLRDRSINPTDEELDELVRLSDGHPYNCYQLIDEIEELGLSVFLGNPQNFIEWKHRYSSEYLQKVELSKHEISILSLLRELPELDFDSIVGATKLSPSDASDALARLSGYHVIEGASDSFSVSPPLRGAVERDGRIRVSAVDHTSAIKFIAQSLRVRIEEGTAPVKLVDAAVLAEVEAGEVLSGFAAAFLLPSHFVWLAKRQYDLRRWDESIRLAKEALKGSARLSLEGRVAAYRYLCLAAARLGDDENFELGIRDLERLANSDWSKSNIAFLRGFNFRLKGNLPRAEEFFRRSYGYSPGNISSAREIAAICLARGRLDEAENFAREAHSHARSNPYLLDILIAVLIQKHGRGSKYMSEINDMFDRLKEVDKETGRSFFSTRKAQFEHLWGDNRSALKWIREAISRTPSIFEPHRLYAEILLKDGNKAKALEEIEFMERIVNSRDPSERRSNYRPYLVTKSHYLTEIGKFAEAKKIYDDSSVFDPDEKIQGVKEVEVIQAYRARR